uniref:Uncharacterized protein n=1 Tax=Pipistrellus kuhlii TaxID=59472 RepID=A0A7J7TB16_PIPKU|nr:hypothetical protein mPipKuh1_009682 [Pipistrellus kuhlii]
MVSSKSESCGPAFHLVTTVPRFSGHFQEFIIASYQPSSCRMARAVQSPSNVVALSSVLHVTPSPCQQGARMLLRTHRTALTSCNVSGFQGEPQGFSSCSQGFDWHMSFSCVARSSAAASSGHRTGAGAFASSFPGHRMADVL